METHVYGCENMWKDTPIYRLDFGTNRKSFEVINDKSINQHHAPIAW